MLHPVDELTPEFIMEVKRRTKQALVAKAIKQHGGTKPTDWICREVVYCDSVGTDFYDIEPKTTWSTGIPAWVIDTTDLGTADDLSAITKAGETVDDDKYIGFFGCFDIVGVPAEAVGIIGSSGTLADNPPATGVINFVQFIRGSSVLDQWATDQLYGYQNMMGITDRPVLFDQTEKLQIKVCATDVATDLSFGFRGFICERVGDVLSPDIDINDPLAGGLHPVQELTKAEMFRIKSKVEARLYQLVVEDGLCKSIPQAMDEYVIREVLIGDGNNATDYIDLDTGTALAVTGLQTPVFDSADMTAGDLKNVLGTYINSGKVRDRAYIGIYGMYDKSTNPCVIGVDFSDGSARKDFWQPEHVYAYHEGIVSALTDRPIYFKQNTPIKLGLDVKVARDLHFGIRALIAEPWGTVISKT